MGAELAQFPSKIAIYTDGAAPENDKPFPTYSPSLTDTGMQVRFETGGQVRDRAEHASTHPDAGLHHAVGQPLLFPNRYW